MNSLPDFCLYTGDEELARRVSAYAQPIGAVRVTDSAKQLLQMLSAKTTGIVLLDMCSEHAGTLVANLRIQQPNLLIVALGKARSDPLLFAEKQGVYAVENSDMERKQFQGMLRRALDYHTLQMENERLKEELARAPSVVHLSQAMNLLQKPSSMHNLSHFTRAFRHSHDNAALVHDIVEGIARCASVGRVGLFMRLPDNGHISLRAGVKCLEGTQDLRFNGNSPLVSYLENCSNVVNLKALNNVAVADTRRMLRQSFEVFGAEVLVPLHLDGRLLGWIFLGQRVSGEPFEAQDLENLMTLGELVTSLLENAMRQDALAVQKDLLDALIDAISMGVIAVSDDEMVRCINAPALGVLRKRGQEVVNRPVEALGTIAHILKSTLEGGSEPTPASWRPPSGGSELNVYVRRLERNGRCLGAFALIQNPEKPVPLDAAVSGELEEGGIPLNTVDPAISHEIKNQLVAINTFIQLLPDRYDDPDFRTQFCELAAGEIAKIKDLLSNDPAETPVDHR